MTTTIPLSTNNEFIARHIGPREADITEMLALMGHTSLDAFIDSIVPHSIKDSSVLELFEGQSEASALRDIKAMAAKNQRFRNHIGQGYYPCHTPAPIVRNLLENPAWYTAYTPYQPEISQGRLEALLNFQTMIRDLTGMDIANASLLDEATAAAEAMTFCKRVSKRKVPAFFVSHACHPQTIAVVKTRADPLGIKVVVGNEATLDAPSLERYFGGLLQYPASTGGISDYRALTQRAHDAGALVTVAADPLALTLLTPPGE